MAVYLFRHGEAFQIGEIPGLHSDGQRPLTPKGEETTINACKGLKALGVGCDEIWHSPLVRAVETARIVGGEMDCDRLIVQEGLADETEGEALFESLSRVDPTTDLFLVGHQPYMGEWTVRLISGSETERVSVSKSGVVCLDLIHGTNPPEAQLRWLMRAKHLRMIGTS